MSEFQLGLLGIGIVVVLVVLAFNMWQERRYRRQSEAALRPHAVDALLEPSMAGQAKRMDEAELPRIPEPAEVDADQTTEASPSSPVSRLNQVQSESSILSNAIDLVVDVEFASETSLSELDIQLQEDRLIRRIRMEALSDGKWEQLRENARYKRIGFGLQLVNRQGPVSVQDLEHFAAWIGDFAGRCNATYNPLDLVSARNAALAIDQFCNEVDILIAVHVVAGSVAFPGTRIRAIAESAGLTIEADGIFRKRDDEGRELYRLTNEGGALFQPELMRELATHSVILEFDVARSPGGNHSFNRFRQFAEHLASGLGGKVVDDNRAPLSGPGFDAIAKELSSVYQTMAARGIAPGSPESLRLFS
jgi:FtsZ-interacting cell division protein ZipA